MQSELRAVIQQVTDEGPGIHILSGPIYVEEAQPGDVLEVRILDVKLAVPDAYNAFTPGHGALPNDFPYACTRIVPLDLKRLVGLFAPGIEVPLRPFFGSLRGAPPNVSGRSSPYPPWIRARIIDNKKMVAGSTLFIPLPAPGVLFSADDGHAAQRGARAAAGPAGSLAAVPFQRTQGALRTNAPCAGRWPCRQARLTNLRN